MFPFYGLFFSQTAVLTYTVLTYTAFTNTALTSSVLTNPVLTDSVLIYRFLISGFLVYGLAYCIFVQRNLAWPDFSCIFLPLLYGCFCTFCLTQGTSYSISSYIYSSYQFSGSISYYPSQFWTLDLYYSNLIWNLLPFTCFSTAVFFLGILEPVSLQQRKLLFYLWVDSTSWYSVMSNSASVAFLKDFELR